MLFRLSDHAQNRTARADPNFVFVFRADDVDRPVRYAVDGEAGSLATISSIEAERSFRLFELWYEQAFWHGRASFRLGQIAADQEFLVTSTGSVFLDGDFGWPTLPSIDLPAGGPAYPLATPGIRLMLQLTPSLTLRAAVFNGNAAADGFIDPQISNPAGTTFRLNGGVFAIAETQLDFDLGGPQRSRPGTLKLGAWLNTNRFLDQHRDSVGLSIANFKSNGFPASHRNNWSFYATAEQVLWRRAGGVDDGLSAFLRLMSAPDDRNQVSVELDGGVAWKNLFAARPNDTIALGFGWFKISQAARGLDRDIVARGLNRPVRSAEGLLEIAYQANIVPWWQLQPDIQYIVRPGGGVPGGEELRSLSKPLRKAFVTALRATITF